MRFWCGFCSGCVCRLLVLVVGRIVVCAGRFSGVGDGFCGNRDENPCDCLPSAYFG